MPDPTSDSDADRRHRATDGRPTVPGYHLLERLGSGTTGTVYRAVQLSLQREVALKILAPELARSQGFLDRFVREARAAGAVHHPNVVTCYDVGEIDGVLYQALELMSGGDLQQYLRSHGGKLSHKEAIRIASECARGLEGIHRAGLVHGDIKPTNIFIAADETVKLADLGMARSLAGGIHGQWDEAAIIGNATTAPEQLSPEGAPDIRTDIYGLGATLFVMATGRPPFPARNRAELAERLRDAPDPDPLAIVPTLPAGLAAVIARAMAREPGARYANPVQFREDLERIFYDFTPIHTGSGAARLNNDAGSSTAQRRQTKSAEGTTRVRRRELAAGQALHRPLPSSNPTASAPQAPSPSPSRRSPGLIVGAVVGVIALAAVIGWLMLPDRRARDPQSVPTVMPVVPIAAPKPVAPTFTWTKPGWAAQRGEDSYGRWADLTVGTITQRLRWCPAGTFTMGSPNWEPGRRDDETTYQVTLSRDFWIGDSEVTQALWEQVVGDNPSHTHDATLPVETVSWHDCQKFLQQLGARLDGAVVRLPTEAEWEYAYRAKDSRAGAGWFVESAEGHTHPVRALAANGRGIHDLGGNVMEWCQDCYGSYPTKSAIDPVGWQGVARVVRGGAWSSPESEGRAAARAHYLPVMRFAFLGFRLVISGQQ